MYPLNLSSSAQTCVCRQNGKRQSLVWEPEIPIIRIETKQKALSLQKEIFWQRDKIHTFGLGRFNTDIYNAVSFSFAEVKVYHLMQKCPVLPNGSQLKQIARDFKRIARCPKCYCIRSRHAARASLHQNPFFENGSKTKHGKFIPNSTYLRMKLKPNSSKIEPHPKTILENQIHPKSKNDIGKLQQSFILVQG